MPRRQYSFSLAFLFVLLCQPVFAEDNAAETSGTHIEIRPPVKTRNGLQTDTGSSKYTFDEESLENLPQGRSTPLDKVLLQAPGVVQDSYGKVRVRGDHGNLQYRINGIILPEGINGFGQVLDTHIAEKIDLLTGALPAQYGYRTAGVVNITTRSGNMEKGGRSSVMVGSNETLQANQELYGSSGNFNYFLSGTYLQNNRGLEPPTTSADAIHDDTTTDRQFGYLSYAFNPEHRLSVIFGNSTNRFEIPNNPGQPALFSLNGVTNPDSALLDERQFEVNRYGIAALQGNLNDDTEYQLAYFARYSEVLFKPDVAGNLVFNGVASRDNRQNLTQGVQNDFRYTLNDAHTVRTGWSFSYEQAETDTLSQTFPCCDLNGLQTSSVPFSIDGSSRQPARLFGTYLQDEWKLTDRLTFNYGARFDYYSAFVKDNQISPRAGLVYEVTPSTTLHAGYARYFTPPPTELIGNGTITAFTNTTAAAPGIGNSAVLPEKSHYFDAGIVQKIGPGFTLGLDAYYKQARHLLDEGQFGQALIFAPFNYEKGWVKGVELSLDYKRRDFTAYGNLALSRGLGKKVESGEYNFDSEELAYTDSNAVALDHDQLWSGSLGTSYTLHTFTYNANLIFGSGLRKGFANTEHLPFYTQLNASITHDWDLGKYGGIWGTRLFVVNLLDRSYAIRDGSGIGVFAPQYGPRRGVFIEISKSF